MPILLQDTVCQIQFEIEHDLQATSFETDSALQVISFRVGFLKVEQDVLMKGLDKGRTRRVQNPTFHAPLPPHQPKYRSGFCVHEQVGKVTAFTNNTLLKLMLNPSAAATKVAQLKECCPALNLAERLDVLWPFLADRVNSLSLATTCR